MSDPIRKALQDARAYLDINCCEMAGSDEVIDSINIALVAHEERAAEPQREPVAWRHAALRGRWQVWRDKHLKVKGVSIVHRASDVGLELHTLGLTDEVAREEMCVELAHTLSSPQPPAQPSEARDALLRDVRTRNHGGYWTREWDGPLMERIDAALAAAKGGG